MDHYNNRYEKMPVCVLYNGAKFPDQAQFADVIVFDTETTGLKSDETDEIIQVGYAGKLDIVPGFMTKSEGDFKVHSAFFKPEINTDMYAVINSSQFNQDWHQRRLIELAYRNGFSQRALAENLAKTFENKIIVAQNGVDFDVEFCLRLFNQYGFKPQFALVDTVPLIYRLGHQPIGPKGVPVFNQAALGHYFNVVNFDAHDAGGDTSQLYRIYQELLKRHGVKAIADLAQVYLRHSVQTNDGYKNKDTWLDTESAVKFGAKQKKLR